MNNDRDLLLVSVFTFLTISLWIFFELTKTTKTTTTTSAQQAVIAPLTPTLDTQIITDLSKRLTY